MEKNGHVKLGLDDFLQHITGSITRVEMKNIGDHIRKGEVMLTLIQNGKKLHIHAPVNGIIQEKNEKLLNHSEYLSSAPFEEGWVYQIEPSNWMKDVQLLFLADRYSRWLKDEFLRLKDFLATLNPVNELQLGYVVLQDGGNVKEHVLDEFGPEIWEEFQEKFLDVIGK
jgi:glycine cleavage system H lipoate-binding protein